MDEFVSSTELVLIAVGEERERQEALVKAGKFFWTCGATHRPLAQSRSNNHPQPITNAEKLAVLAEEFGEAAREVTEEIIARDRDDKKHELASRNRLRKELIQVAAVCVAWVEALDKSHEEV